MREVGKLGTLFFALSAKLTDWCWSRDTLFAKAPAVEALGVELSRELSWGHSFRGVGDTPFGKASAEGAGIVSCV